MPITTDLSVSPYFDDYDENKKFVRPLWKPEVAVQTRELNQGFDYIQAQIERFGNNIFKRGTIIDGANFIFYDNYPYIKITDTQLDGIAAIPGNYVGMFAKNTNGLTAYVLDYQDGFESTNPDLKTLYLKYTNSGNSYTDTAFSVGDVVTLTNANNSIFKYNIISSGTGYANADPIIVTPVIEANVSSGALNVGDTITDTITAARGIITAMVDKSVRTARINLGGTVAVAAAANVIGTGTNFLSDFSNGSYISIYANATYYEAKKINVVSNSSFMNLVSNVSFTNPTATYANTTDSRTYITYRPVASDLANSASTSNTWSFSIGSIVQGNGASNIADVSNIIGENAAGVAVTDSAGRLIGVTLTNQGDGYTQVPYASLKSVAGTGANVVAQNFMAQVTVSSLAGSTGSGYAFGITEGIVYQKGYFIKVDPQTIIVSKYTNVPDAVAVGFATSEEIITAAIDTSLNDNVTGFNDANAPGADRLKLEANLAVVSVSNAASNTNFFNLVEWSNGVPYKQNNRTAYNIINDEAANRTADVSGNFVVDRFLVATTSPANTSLSANTMSVVVDPGTAYIDGYKVQTLFNYTITSPKAFDTLTQTNTRVSLNYQSYVRVHDVGGFFEFDRANLVDLYDTAKGFLSNATLISTGSLSPAGAQIGQARIRSFVYEQGTPGSPNAIYRMYLFDINMFSGKSFRDVRSIYGNSTTVKGIADVQVEYDSTTAANVAVLYGNNNILVFDSGFSSPLSANNIDYFYRTIDETQGIANTGVVSVLLSGSPTKAFPYTGTLTDAQKSEIVLIPEANLFAQNALTGTVSVNTTSAVVTGAGTDFAGQLKAGLYVNINGGTSNNINRRIVSITNSTFMTVDSNATYTASGITFRKAWPGYVPIELPYNISITANTSVTRDTLNINLGSTLNVATNTAVIVAYNVENQNPSPTAKAPQRNQLVLLKISNNAGLYTGPWSLGVPDIFRLRNVYRGNSSVSTSSLDVTSEFYIDTNQNSNYYNLSSLNRRPNSTIALTDDDYLLVQFDCFTTSPGFYNIGSYVSSNLASRFIEDSKPLANLSSTINTLEIPEVYDGVGNYFDLIGSVDFRPYVDATANITANVSLITTNPANTVSFSALDRFFPTPDSIYRHDITYFVPRIDTVALDKNQKIKVISGTSGSNSAPMLSSGTMRLNDIFIPAYPSLPGMISSTVSNILNTKVHSTKFNSTRIKNRSIRTLFTSLDYNTQQPLNYTEEKIGQLDRRVSNLEYAALLNLLQASVTNRVIPSSISPNIDRFKFGFYVDDYTDTSFSETDSPEYYATVLNSFALPLMAAFNTVHTGPITSSPYTASPLVSQLSATSATVVVTPPPAPTSYVGTLTIVPPFFKSQSYTEVVTSSAAASTSTTTTTSSSSGGKIVCTAMNEEYGFGTFRQAIWLENSRGLDPAYQAGYHALFLGLVNRVYRSDKKDTLSSRLIKAVGERIVRKRTADIWKQKRGRIDVEGRIYRTILEPICYVFGKFEINKTKKRNK